MAELDSLAIEQAQQERRRLRADAEAQRDSACETIKQLQLQLQAARELRDRWDAEARALTPRRPRSSKRAAESEVPA